MRSRVVTNVYLALGFSNAIILFAGMVLLLSGERSPVSNFIVSALLSAALVGWHFLVKRHRQLQRVEGLRQRFDADVLRERVEVEQWYAAQEELARLEAYREANWEHHVPTAETKAHQEHRRRQLDEHKRELGRRSNRGFGRYLEPTTSGDMSQERIQAAAAKHFSIAADQVGVNYSTLAQRQRDLILRPFPYDVIDTSTVESWGVLEPVRRDAPWVSVTNNKGEVEVLEYDPTTGELGYSG